MRELKLNLGAREILPDESLLNLYLILSKLSLVKLLLFKNSYLKTNLLFTLEKQQQN